VKILQDTRASDGKDLGATWPRRMRGCLVMLILPTLVVLSIVVLRPQARVRALQMNNANNAAFSPDGQSFAIPAGAVTTVRIGNSEVTGYRQIDLHSTATLHVVRSIKTALTRHITFHPDGQMLAIVGVDAIIRLYRLADGLELRTFEGLARSSRSIIFSPDGQLIAASGTGRFVQLWRVSDGKLLNTLSTRHSVDNIAFSPDGQLLAADEDAGDVVIWQIGDNREIRRLKEDNVSALNFSPDGSFLAIGIIYSGPGSLHGEVHVYNLKTNDVQPTWNLYLGDFVHSIAFDSTGQFIAAGGGFAGVGGSIFGDGDFWPVRKIAIWRMRDGQRMQTIRTPHKEIADLVFSADSGTLISTGRDRNFEGNLCFWRVIPQSNWWDWWIPGSFIAVLVGQMLWSWYRRR